MNRKILQILSGVFVIGLIAVSFARPVGIQHVSASDFADVSLLAEIHEYARDNHIGLDQAAYRFDLMDDIGIDYLEKELSTKEEETFGGLWFQHQPTFRIVIACTSDGEETVQSYVNNQSWSHLVQIYSVPVALVELQSIEDKMANIWRELGIKFYSDINILESYAEFYVTDQALVDAILQEAKVKLPERVRIFQVDQLVEPEADIYGGLGVTFT